MHRRDTQLKSSTSSSGMSENLPLTPCDWSFKLLALSCQIVHVKSKVCPLFPQVLGIATEFPYGDGKLR